MLQLSYVLQQHGWATASISDGDTFSRSNRGELVMTAECGLREVATEVPKGSGIISLVNIVALGKMIPDPLGLREVANQLAHLEHQVAG